MKKFWSLMLVALVTLGAAACSEKDENVDTKQEATVSFYAEFADDTRADLVANGEKSWKTTFTNGDVLTVGGFEFTHNGEKFVCNEEGVQNIIGTNVTITGDFGNSTTGKNAVKIEDLTIENFQSGEKVTLKSELSFFMFNYNGELKLTASENIFKAADNTPTTEITLTADGETFVAFYPTGNNTTISYSIEDVKCKEVEINFATGKVYNLGKLLKKSTTLAYAGSWEAMWDVDHALYEDTNWYVAYNVNCPANTEFKFKNVGNWDASYGQGGTNATAIDKWSICGGSNIKIGTEGKYDFYLSKDFSQYLVAKAGTDTPDMVAKKTYYLNTGGASLWNQGEAWFLAHFWDANGVTLDIKMVLDSGNTYKAEVYDFYNQVIFLRMAKNGTQANMWTEGNDGYWNKTDNLTIPAGKNQYTITGWGGTDGSWSIK